MIRRPAVAGQFYPADPDSLRKDIEAMAEGRKPPEVPRAIAVMVPHAGYVYSGRVAAATYAAVRPARRLILLGPNHTGEGEAIAVMDRGVWQSPLGETPLDQELAAAILARCPAARVDDAAHRREHSLEVQVPFLQVLISDFRFVPICIGTLSLPALIDLGDAVAEAVRQGGEEVLIVISSDMSHYLPASVAERLDRRVIDRILALDPGGLHRLVLGEGISMCGLAPAVAGLEAARRLGARAARLVAYATSGDTTGDVRSVVGYAGVAIT
jgi:AmmeMemoRadiSam system protein B